ncbi:MAG: cyclopropane fatty acyl phospholipid synthase [Hyphomicrobiaceae bacterium]
MARKPVRQKIAKRIIEAFCADVDVRLNGDRPRDPEINDDRFFSRVLSEGSLGLGESYMLGWWDCDDLFAFFAHILTSDELERYSRTGWRTSLASLRATLFNTQTRRQSRQMADVHYNLGNEFFEHMLGPSMAYSCAYWADTEYLTEAQHAKFELICRKLHLKRGDRLLDIGCGWGGLAKYAAENYGVEIVGVTVAEQQATYARELCAGLPVTIHCADYREFDHREFGKPFDKVVSVGMVEHVGSHNYRDLMDIVAKSMRDQGLFLLHTIGSDISITSGDPWLSRYIFPGGVLPSIRQLSEAAEGFLILQDVQNIGTHYTKTLLSWHERFDDYSGHGKDTGKLPLIWESHDVFYRMWRYYLLLCAASFHVGHNQVYQIVFAKRHLPSGYDRAHRVRSESSTNWQWPAKSSSR